MTEANTIVIPKENVVQSNYGTEFSQMLQCFICSDYCNENRECKECGQLFCRVCLEGSLRECPSCPKCRVQTSVNGEGEWTGFSFNRFANQLIGNLDVRCPNEECGCTTPIIKRNNFKNHLEKECTGRRIHCRNLSCGCTFSGNSGELEHHYAEECFFEKEIVKAYIKRIMQERENQDLPVVSPVISPTSPLKDESVFVEESEAFLKLKEEKEILSQMVSQLQQEKDQCIQQIHTEKIEHFTSDDISRKLTEDNLMLRTQVSGLENDVTEWRLKSEKLSIVNEELLATVNNLLRNNDELTTTTEMLKGENTLLQTEYQKTMEEMKRYADDNQSLLKVHQNIELQYQQGKRDLEATMEQLHIVTQELETLKKNVGASQPQSSYMAPPPYPMDIPYSAVRVFKFFGDTIWTRFQGKEVNSKVPGWEAIFEVDDAILNGNNVKGSTINPQTKIEKRYYGVIRNGGLDVTVEWSDGRKAKYVANNLIVAHGVPVKLNFTVIATGKQGGCVGDDGFNIGAIEQLQ